MAWQKYAFHMKISTQKYHNLINNDHSKAEDLTLGHTFYHHSCYAANSEEKDRSCKFEPTDNLHIDSTEYDYLYCHFALRFGCKYNLSC